MKRLSLIAIGTALVLFSSGCIQNTNYSSLEASMPTISVQGKGKIETIPDEATTRFGVVSDAKSLSSAYKDNTAKMNSIISVVKNMGIEAKDIKTSSYNVTPVYPKDEKGYVIPGKPASFKVSQELTVKIRDISKVGEIIDEVIASGTNEFNGLDFTSSKIDELQDEAKVKAAKNAKEKASLLAKSLGVKIGKILRVDTSSSKPYPVARGVTAFKAMETAPQIEAGSMEVVATCNIVFEIIE